MIQAYKAAFAELLAPLVDMDVDKVVSMVERPPANIEGDFGFPCFSLAKVMKKAPNMIAQGMMETLNKQGGHDFFAKILAVGPYVNVILDTSGLAEKVLLSVIQEAQNYGKGSKKSETWLVE